MDIVIFLITGYISLLVSLSWMLLLVNTLYIIFFFQLCYVDSGSKGLDRLKAVSNDSVERDLFNELDMCTSKGDKRGASQNEVDM